MRHVLVIGGPPGSGKTSIARRLARRHGLRLYSADTRTWVHRDRAIDGGSEAAQRFEQLSPVDRWAQPTEDLVAMSLHHERAAMVLDDLRELPAQPLIMAEGTPIPPSMVSSGLVPSGHTVWLLPTAAFQEQQLTKRGAPDGHVRLYRRLRTIIAAEAEGHGVEVELVDGSRSLDEVTSAVEARFGDVIRAGACAVTEPDRRDLLREMNQAVIDQIRGFHARPWAGGDPSEVRADFVCECGGAACEAVVSATIADAAHREVLAAGHAAT